LGGTIWSINFAPDGRLFFTNRDQDQVRVGALDLSSKTVTTFSSTAAVRDVGEAGVMGMELDPGFAQNGRLYICYSYYAAEVSDANQRNRLSVFTLSGNGLSEQILFDDMPGWFNHNGCRVVYGPDGKLYFSMGDAPGLAGGANKAQDKTSLGGKIFRINPDGSIPNDNPFFASLTGSAKALWTLGHRNPQGLGFQPGTNLLWSTEHGPDIKDELNLIKKGKNYGWPDCGGIDACNVPDYQPAVKAYEPDNSTTVAISDLIFYGGEAFPAWKGSLLFVTLKTGRLYRVELSGETVGKEERLINNQFGRLRDVTTGPDGFIYLSTDDGRVLRVVPE
jgi:glucose/arabinose dehydrogenase